MIFPSSVSLDAEGNPFRQPVPYRISVVEWPRAPVLDVNAPGTSLVIPPDRLQHILNKHTWRNRTPSPKTGMFYPTYSSPQAIIELANDAYGQATPDDVQPSRGGGRYAVIAVGLFLLETTTRTVTPRLVGTVTPAGPPTNLVALFMTSSDVLWTMYPIGPTVVFDGDD